MKIKPGFKLHNLGNEYIVVAEGDAMIDYSSILSLNESGAVIWKAIEGVDFDVDTITQVLLDEYEITEETAANDASDFVESLLEADLVME